MKSTVKYWQRIQLLLVIALAVVITSTTQAKGFDKNDNDSDKIRVCIVEGRGSYKKAGIYCPALEATSNVQCVIGVDRLDCVRRINKGSAHFGVFSAEDLVAARWSGVELLITSEMRYHSAPFEYDVVAIVDNEAGIHSAQDLRGSKFCHPGHGMENHWTEILANYFESTLTLRQCEPELSLAESRIKASAAFFGPSCKAGPWVPDPVQDRVLKSRYPSLCELCYNPYVCGVGDKHWGRRGPLYCLTSGAGEVAWARLDDTRAHFGLTGLTPEADQHEYSYLCPDGHLQPINTTRPCVWVAKPWPAIAVKRNLAEKVQKIIDQVSHNVPDSWQNALLNLLETFHVNITALDMAIPIDDYLDQADGFQSAYSFPSCNPPRSVVYCTSSLIQHAKCSWLQEAASVQGVEPNLQCIRANTHKECMDDTKHNVADVVLVNQDERLRAQRDFNLRPILYEFSPNFQHRYVVVAVTLAKHKYTSFKDFENKKACFPSFEGAAFLSVAETLWSRNLVDNSSCTPSETVIDYFKDNSCTWAPESDKKSCPNEYQGDEGALKCLFDGGSVAFISLEMLKNFTTGQLNKHWANAYKPTDLKVMCPFGKNAKIHGFDNDICYMHWTPVGQLMIHKDTTLARRNEIYNSLRDMDRLFGKHYQTHTLPFTLFGPFDKKSNVMFQDTTDGLRGIVDLRKDRAPRSLEDTFDEYASKVCSNKSSAILRAVSSLYLIGFVSVVKWQFNW